jgi:hypothetical protein
MLKNKARCYTDKTCYTDKKIMEKIIDELQFC